MAISGLLLEISNKENRITYAGISGAGSIVPLFFLLLAGILISTLGYIIVFVFTSIILLTSYLFITKLKCRTELTKDVLIKLEQKKEL